MTGLFNKILLVLLFVSVTLYSQEKTENFSSSSVLSTGRWYKMAITEDGIYRIDYSQIKQLGLDYPSNPVVFGNNAGQLSYYNDGNQVPDDLKEIAIFTEVGNDNIFGEGDYLLFFGRATHRWVYDEITREYYFVRHNYSDTAFYFITSLPVKGKIISASAQIQAKANNFSSVSDALFIHETETENIIKSGREWYQPVSSVSGTKIDPGFTDIVVSEPVRYSIRVLARASVNTMFRISENGMLVRSVMVSDVNLSSMTGTYAQISEAEGSVLPSSASPAYEIKFYNNGETSAKGWIDYVELKGRKFNIYNGTTAFFSDCESVAAGSVTEFTIKSSTDGITVWDVTDPFNAGIVQTSGSGSGKDFLFTVATDTLRTFVAFTAGNAKRPLIRTTAVKNQDLHSTAAADMIIIAHPLFMEHAARLASIHYKNSGLLSIAVTPEQIYNEFSGGIPDIVAIRNFIRMKFLKQKGTVHPLKYLLLFGDGSYENRTPPPGNPDFVPTYQSKNSNVIISSFVSDDFYSLLEDGEGEDYGTEDIGIGRLPVSDTTEAGIIVSKIAGYLNRSDRGNWKNIVSLIADDEDSNTHMSNAEDLAGMLADSVPWVNVDKIYFDAYKQITTTTGQFYPDVTQAITDRINSGTLILNYTGHGNETGLGHERVVTAGNIAQWKNKSRLPLFITATCEFSRFDNADINPVTGEMTKNNSAGEKILLSSSGGAIALMSTTRLVYSAPNFSLNRNILDVAFDLEESGHSPRMGDIIRLAKNKSGTNTNKRNFMLLGDPAVRLSFPWQGNVVTDSVNGIPVSENTDTLKALSLMTISGHIDDQSGNLLTNFNGIVIPEVLGKVRKVETLANDGGEKMEFGLQNNILFSGKTTAEKGLFRFTFLVPRDIDYTYGQGKISYYASDDNRDMNGCYDRIVAGGFNNVAQSDTTGPEISLYLNDTLFRSGGMTNSSPKLLAIIEDSGGINTSGTGIGHDLACWLDNDRDKTFVLNNYFENDYGSYSKGRVQYDLTALEPGSHILTLKVWDNFNNSSLKSLKFTVETGSRFVLKNLINYPNPFLTGTFISAEHNRPEAAFQICVRIFSLSGKIVRILKSDEQSTGFQLHPIYWDGNDEGGERVSKGMYIYKVTVSDDNGETCTLSGRMIIL